MQKVLAQPYHKVSKKKIDFEHFRERIKLKTLESRKSLAEKHPHVEKFFQRKGLDLAKIREHSARILGAGAITGALLLTPPSPIKELPPPQELIEKLKGKDKLIGEDVGKNQQRLETKKILIKAINSVLPKNPRPLLRDEEKFLEQIFQNILGIPARATLEGEHLNTTYGFIGIEQHLRRYPGDRLKDHGEGTILKAGMAPGLGAWGYFASSKDSLTPELENIEKWYAAVQTLYLPGWNVRSRYLKEWYKYRKVLIVDVDNARAVVAAIADSGPAAWTGKQFGGSPEVMQYLGGQKYKKGRVIVFFVDDPENTIKLGPVDYE